MGEGVERLVITVGEKANREGQEDKNVPDSAIVHAKDLKHIFNQGAAFLYHNYFIASLSQNGCQQAESCQTVRASPDSACRRRRPNVLEK